MQINGVKLDFAMYNEDKADVKERYFKALERMKRVKEDVPDGTDMEKSRYLCGRIKELFDYIFGAGTGEAVCGASNDLLLHISAYDQLVSEQLRQDAEFERIMKHLESIADENGPAME